MPSELLVRVTATGHHQPGGDELDGRARLITASLAGGRGQAPGGYSDQVKSINTGVDVATEHVTRRCTPAFALAFAIAGTPHS